MKSDRDAIQAALPSYDVGVELGRGAWGVVYGGRHRRLHRDVAIKQLPRAFGADDAVRQRFVHEARLAAALEHPHIVPVYDFVEDESGLCLIVMERCDGTLADRFRSTGLATDEACAAALATCSALDYAHGRNVLHRDIKPENLLYDSDDVLKLADFGIARALDEATRLTATGTVMGTPAYMSPEQAGGEDLTAASDVYSTGVMLYELLTGELPFADASSIGALIRQHLTEPPRPLRSVAPEVPSGIADVVDRSIQKSPADRYAGTVELGIAIGEGAARAFGPGWLRVRRFQLHASTEILAATERDAGGAGRAGTVVVRGRPRHDVGAPDVETAAPVGVGAGADAGVGGTGGGGGGTTPPRGRSAGGSGGPGQEQGSTAGEGTRRARKRLLVIGAAAVGVVVIGAIAALALGGGGGGGGGGSEAGASLTLGAIFGDESTADQEVTVDLAKQDVVAAGGSLDLLDGSSERDVERQIDDGATVIVGPAGASETTALLDEVDGRVVTISQSDFFERDVGADERYFRTKPTFTLLASAVPDVLPAEGRVVIVDGDGAPASDGATATALRELLVGLGYSVDVQSAGSDPGVVAQQLTSDPADAVVLVGVVDPGEYYAPLFAAGVTPATTRIVALGDDGWASGFPDGALDGVVGVRFDVLTGRGLEDRVPATSLSADAAQAYDAVIVAALAADAAGSGSARDIAAQLPRVTSGKHECDSYARCRKLLLAGETVDYQGISGPLALDPKSGRRRAALVTRTEQGATIGDAASETIVVREQ